MCCQKPDALLAYTGTAASHHRKAAQANQQKDTKKETTRDTTTATPARTTVTTQTQKGQGTRAPKLLHGAARALLSAARPFFRFAAPQHATARPWHPKQPIDRWNCTHPELRRHNDAARSCQAARRVKHRRHTSPLPPKDCCCMRQGMQSFPEGANRARHTQGQDTHTTLLQLQLYSQPSRIPAGRAPPQRRQACMTRTCQRLPERLPFFVEWVCVSVHTTSCQCMQAKKSCITGAVQ